MKTLRAKVLRRLVAPVVLLAGGAASLAQVDPFYIRLLEDGAQKLSQESSSEAARDLRLACFGLLDDPQALGRGLALLAIASAEIDDRNTLDQTVERLVELEDRFGVLRDVSLSESERERSAKALQGRLSATLLHALTGLESSQPSTPGRQLELARLDVQEGKLKQAARRLDSLVEAMPESAEVRCLRLEVSTARKQCAGIIEDSPFCDSSSLDLSAARSRLECLVRHEEWGLARQVVVGLEQEVRTQPRLQRLIGRVTKESDRLPPAVEPIEEVEATGPKETETVSWALAMAGPVLQEAEEALLTASDVAELESHLESIESLMILFPDNSEARVLAARIAYRASLWEKTVRYLRDSRAAVDASPSLQFSLAVALYESGHRQEAAKALIPALPFLEPSSFVLSYESKILDPINRREGD